MILQLFCSTIDYLGTRFLLIRSVKRIKGLHQGVGRYTPLYVL